MSLMIAATGYLLKNKQDELHEEERINKKTAKRA